MATSLAPLRVGICGLGTVAQGVLRLLSENASSIALRAGRPVEVVRVASRRARPGVDLGAASFGTDLRALATDPDIDVLVELIGGEELALELLETALKAGKPVVTANKAVLALHGDALMALANVHRTTLGFEAAVAGGIPVIVALTRGLAGNRVRWLAGIINGTSNYILSAMTSAGRRFADALAEAQALGYAEADPTFDVEGIDAAHKLTILSALAFGTRFRFADVYTEGISAITPEDIEFARQLGYRIKHLGIARDTGHGIEARVHPALVPAGHMLASVDGVMNAVLIHSNAAGDTLYVGAGAGALPTASAVVADLIDVARDTAGPPAPDPDVDQRMLGIEDIVSAYYLRIPALDRPGVFARVATVLSEYEISIEAAVQRAEAVHRDDGGPWVPIIIVTQDVPERVMNEALAAVQALPDVVGQIMRIRVADLGHD
ncbi:MAG: homoserine dehydrogenase [Pseudomonadales bacterium]